MHELDADAVLALARSRGHDWIDRETAARIAAGASAAIRAVLEARIGAVGASEPVSFIDELSALAGRGT
jgi:hypothetical protein